MKINFFLDDEQTMTQVKKPYRLLFDGGILYEGDDMTRINSFKEYCEKEGVDISDKNM
jgi:hypothetical protein